MLATKLRILHPHRVLIRADHKHDNPGILAQVSVLLAHLGTSPRWRDVAGWVGGKAVGLFCSKTPYPRRT